MMWKALVLASVVSVVATLSSSVAAQDATRGYTVDVEPGLAPQMTPEAVAQVVLTRLAQPQVIVPDTEGRAELAPAAPTIWKMECVSGEPWKVEPKDAPGDRVGPDVVWIVHAKGRFASRRTTEGRKIVKSYGFFRIDDATGEVVGRGSVPWLKPPEETE